MIEKLEPIVEAGMGDGKPLTDLVDKLFDYINALSEPLGIHDGSRTHRRAAP